MKKYYTKKSGNSYLKKRIVSLENTVFRQSCMLAKLNEKLASYENISIENNKLHSSLYSDVDKKRY